MRHPNLHLHAVGDYPPGGVRAEWVADTRPHIPQIQAAIETAWQEASSQLGARLFDGPMCRLESFQAGQILQLNVSPTTYKVFLGTNVANPQFAQTYEPAALANPIGVSSVVQSSDGLILLGHRSESVAYYARRIHTFGGTLEPHDPVDVFAEARRELTEELGIADRQIEAINCLGLVEDTALHQPELIFAVKVGRGIAQLQESLDSAEHRSVFAIPAQSAAMTEALGNDALTPVAAAALLLLGRHRFGEQWFDANM